MPVDDSLFATKAALQWCLLLPDYFIHFRFSWTGIFPVFAEAAQHIYVHTKDNLLGSTVHTEVHGPGRQNWRVCDAYRSRYADA